jgi:hypothetical protein
MWVYLLAYPIVNDFYPMVERNKAANINITLSGMFISILPVYNWVVLGTCIKEDVKLISAKRRNAKRSKLGKNK